MINKNTKFLPMIIEKSALTKEIEDVLAEGFGQYELDVMGKKGSTPYETRVVKIDEVVVGIAVFRIQWGACHLRSLFVAKEHRKKGIATMLLEHVIDFAKQNKCGFIFLDTWNYQAADFYKKRGFITECIRSGFAQNASQHFMRMDL